MSWTDPGAPGPLSPAEASDLGHLLRQVLGTTAVATQIWVARRHDDYAVLLVRLAGSSARLVVKLAGPRAPIAALFDRTAAILRSVRDRTTVPTVDVLAADVSYCHGPWRYLITTYAPGSPWSTTLPRLTTEEARSVHRELGEAVAEIHLLDFPAFGEISVDGTIQPGASSRPSSHGPLTESLTHTTLNGSSPYSTSGPRTSGTCDRPRCAMRTSTRGISCYAGRTAGGACRRSSTSTAPGRATPNPIWHGWSCGEGWPERGSGTATGHMDA